MTNGKVCNKSGSVLVRAAGPGLLDYVVAAKINAAMSLFINLFFKEPNYG